MKDYLTLKVSGGIQMHAIFMTQQLLKALASVIIT